MLKKRIAKVIIERAEGPIEYCKRMEFPTLVEAQVQAYIWGGTAPDKGHGYDKCDFELVFEDGQSYKGRYDLVKGGLNDDGKTIQGQVIQFLSYTAGSYHPAWMKDDLWQSTCEDNEKSGEAQFAREFLEAYEI